MARGRGRKRRRLRENHAAVQASLRYDGSINLEAIRKEVHAGRVTYLMRQTTSRSLVAVQVEGTWVFPVLDRRRSGVVTVLSPEQAKMQCGDSGSTAARTLARLLDSSSISSASPDEAQPT